MIPQETVNLILDTARIEDVINDFVALKRRGANFIACCPFHNEKTPSFYVSPSKGIYKCFGCGKAGSAVGFIMEHEHYSYIEALRFLAKKYNIEIVEKEESAEDIALRQKNESLMLVSEFAAKFFVDSLSTKEGQAIGYAYFRSRGLEDDTIRKYGLGWAPKSRHDLTAVAAAAGYKSEYLLETGLCAQSEDGRIYDRFSDRVMFPIHSVSGRVIAFGGRTLRTDGNIAKYVNSKESEIYVKSNSLYGISFAKNEISRRDKCYLVEGYLDVLSMHQLGILNVVASSGTSLTEGQIRIIKKFTDNVTIMYDGDKAGIHAALRGIGMILEEGMNVKVVLIPDGDDPDSYSRKHTLEEVTSFIEANEQDFITFKTDLLLDETGGDPLKRANLINDIADTIALIPDAVKRSVYVDACAAKFKIEPGILFNRINSSRKKKREEGKVAADRARRREQAGLDPEGEGNSAAVPAREHSPQEMTMASLIENPIVAPAESDLLYFILRNGTDAMEFESDSAYYSGDEYDKPTVTDFIRESLEADGTSFINTAFRNVYEAYLALYDEGWLQDDIIRNLLNSPDRTVAFVTAALSMERYQLTVDNFKKALTTTSSWLVAYVPKAILIYADKRLESRIADLRKALASTGDSDMQMNIMKEIMRYQTAQKKVKAKWKSITNELW